MNTIFEPKTQEPKRRASHEESQSAISYPSRTIVHAKLEMTSPGDQDEQEADAVANEVVNGGIIARKISGGGGSSGIVVPRQMESRLMQLQGGGQPLSGELRSMMENGFGQGFPQVRLHTDAEAVSMSSRIGAKAFTFGNDIYFNRGQFAPETSVGQRLVAHELTHVVQAAGKVGREPELYDDSNDSSLDSDTSMQERPSIFDRFGLKNDPVEALHEMSLGIQENNTDFLKSLLEYQVLRHKFGPIVRQEDENQAILVYNKNLNKGFAGTPRFVESASRAEAAPYYREIFLNMSGGLFGAYMSLVSQQRGDNLMQQLEASRAGAALDEWLGSHYGVRSVTPTGGRRLKGEVLRRFVPIERADFNESKPAVASDIKGPEFPRANFTVTQNSISNEAPTTPKTPGGNASNVIDYAPITKSTPAPSQFIIPVKNSTTPKANIPQLVRNELHGVENSPNKQRYLNRTINNIRYYVKDSPQKDVYNMYLYNAETNLQLGKTGEAVRSLRALEKAVESTETK